MNNIEIDSKNLQQAAAALPADTPILMLNLLRYKQQADYGDDTNMPPCSGREAYFNHYIPAFYKIAMEIPGIQPFFFGNTLHNLVAPANEVWDNVALVEYPGFASFLAVIQHPTYAIDAEPHRFAALEDWRLIVTIKAGIP